MSKLQILQTLSAPSLQPPSLQPPMPLDPPIAVNHPLVQIRQRITAIFGRVFQLALAIVFTVVAIALVVLSTVLMVMVELEERLLGRYRQSRRNQSSPPNKL